MAPTAAKSVNDFIEKFKKETEQIVTETFPKKVLEIDALFNEVKSLQRQELDQFVNIPYHAPVDLMNDTSCRPTTSSEPDPSPSGPRAAKKRKLTDSNQNHNKQLLQKQAPAPQSFQEQGAVQQGPVVRYNKTVHDYLEKSKPFMKDLMEHANKVRMWINFLIPKIEDGNNFGVEIQEEVLGQATAVESEASKYLDEGVSYFVQRAKLLTKVTKYPNIEDYRQSVKQFDEKFMLNLQNSILEMRNHYASLHDLIIKNINKIKNPRTENAMGNMY